MIRFTHDTAMMDANTAMDMRAGFVYVRNAGEG